MKVYLVTVNSDQTEGKGHQVPEFIFNSLFEADRYVKSHGNYSSLYDIMEFDVLNKFESLDKMRDVRDKANALRRLTDREKKLLGLE